VQSLTYSQNFLVDQDLVSKLVDRAIFKPEDTILDIGAGKGIITKELVKYTNNVIGIEIDERFKAELSKIKGGSVVYEDFLNYLLPDKPFKTFSNVPFNRTAEILKRLLASNFFSEGFLVMQEDACKKYGGEQLDCLNTMLSVIYGASYTFDIAYKFSNSDFSPIPQFNIVLLHIQTRKEPLVDANDKESFYDFVSYIFNCAKFDIGSLKELFSYSQLKRFKQDISLDSSSKPSEIMINQYIYLFNFLKNKFPESLLLTKGHYMKNVKDQSSIQKIHRSRRDSNWKMK
jgi:23S rRNA (adenine-N6)-dimethyltransferase